MTAEWQNISIGMAILGLTGLVQFGFLGCLKWFDSRRYSRLHREFECAERRRRIKALAMGAPYVPNPNPYRHYL